MPERTKIFFNVKGIILFFLLLHSVYMYAGGTVKVRGHKFVIVPFVSAIWQRTLFGDISLAHVYDIHFVNHHPGHIILAYSKLGAEFNSNFPKVTPENKYELWAPKFSSEIDIGFFCVRGAVEDYIAPRKNDFYLTPEFGLSLAGFITLTAGYNKPLTHTVEGIPPLRISLSLMIPVVLSGSSKQKK